MSNLEIDNIINVYGILHIVTNVGESGATIKPLGKRHPDAAKLLERGYKFGKGMPLQISINSEVEKVKI